jgi:predicted DNA-binding transcriptional regulator YafY
MPRGDQLARQWRVIQTIVSSGRGKSAAELADELDCNPRTLYRDLEALQVAGFPIYNERKDGKNLWFLLDAVKHQTPIPFSLTELMALYFSRDMLKILHDTVFYDSLESLFQKITATLPPQSEKFLKNVQQALYVTQKHYKQYGKYKDIIRRVNDAAIGKKTVEAVYYTMSRKKQTRRKVDPYRIWFFNNTFYLVGYCHLRKEIRIFALDRLKEVQGTEEKFTIPEDFDFEDLMRGSFGIFKGKPEKIRVRFESDVSGYIEEKIWHDSQKIHSQDDGSIVFEAEVAVNQELMFWILSWGSKAEVLEPKSLTDEMHAETKKMFENYKKNR